MENITEKIRSELVLHADEKVKESGQRYFKEKVNLYGLKSKTMYDISKKAYELVRNKDKKGIFEICEELFRSSYFEEAIIACNLSYYLKKQFQASDFNTFEKWVFNYVSNWAVCDTLCNHTIGTFIEMYPEFIEELKKWTQSKNRWVKRAAAVSFIIPARQGKFFDHILDIANSLLIDKDDMVQKGYGWMLKAASKPYQTEVFNYVQKNKSVMPRTALRYAIEKMPENMRKLAMAK